MLSENWGTLWEAIADVQPDHVAVVVGETEVRWRDLDLQASKLATALADRGVEQGTKVAQLMFNCPEYLETVYAAFKLRAVPVNVNYRYLADEIAYVLDNAEAEVLVFHGSLGARVAEARQQLPKLRLLLQVDDDGSPLVDGAAWFHEVIAGSHPASRIARSGDDILLLYTGGTTGRPKGVIWPHRSLWGAMAFPAYGSSGLPVPETAAAVGELAGSLQVAGSSPVNLCAPPLMHGTALFLGMGTFVMGGTIVLLGERRFDPDELLRLVERHRVSQISIVGDAFARPIAQALSAGSYDVSSLKRVVSTGATFSAEHKALFQRYAPEAVILDLVGASEGGPFAISMTMPGTPPATTSTFVAPANVVVLDDDGRAMERGDPHPGVLACSGPHPSGYYRDDVKTAETFRTVDGVRYTVPGDYATIDADGVVHLLGRGSVSINTGGEKIYPDEVEVAALDHPGVFDCIAVGTPDPRFGEHVTLVASRAAGVEAADEDVVAHMRRKLASYKLPKRIVWVDQVYRSPSGKGDYRWAKQVAVDGSAP